MPGKTRRIGAVTPENIEPELVIDGTCDLQDNLSGMADNLTGHIHDSSAKRRRIAARVKHRLTDIDLETLVQEKRQKLDVVEGGIGRKTTKRKRFGAKVLESSMDELIASPLVIALQDGFSCQPPRLTGFCKLAVNGLAAAQIGVKDGIGTGKFEPALQVVVKGSAVESPAKLLPLRSAVSKFHISPFLILAFVTLPVQRQGYLGDLFIELSGNDVADLESFQCPHDLSIEESAVGPHDDRNVSIVAANLFDQSAQTVDRFLTVIGMLAAASKYGIDDITTPGDLKRLKAFDLLVSGSHSFPTKSRVVVHHHGIDAQDDQIRLFQRKPPQKQLMEKPAKQTTAGQIKGCKEAFDRMGGEHRLRSRLDTGCIPGIFLKLIEKAQMTAASIDKETEQLFEDLTDRLTLSALSQVSEKGFQMRQDSDTAEIANEQAQAGARGQSIGRLLDSGDGL